MALISNLPVADVAALVARALEDLLGHDVVLSTGTPELGRPDRRHPARGPTRTIVLPFADGVIGELSLVVGESFATAMEAATDDASLTSAAVPTLDAGAGAISFTIGVGVNVADAGEIATETLLTSVVGDFAAVPDPRERGARRLRRRARRRRRARPHSHARRRAERPNNAPGPVGARNARAASPPARTVRCRRRPHSGDGGCAFDGHGRARVPTAARRHGSRG